MISTSRASLVERPRATGGSDCRESSRNRGGSPWWWGRTAPRKRLSSQRKEGKDVWEEAADEPNLFKHLGQRCHWELIPQWHHHFKEGTWNSDEPLVGSCFFREKQKWRQASTASWFSTNKEVFQVLFCVTGNVRRFDVTQDISRITKISNISYSCRGIWSEQKSSISVQYFPQMIFLLAGCTTSSLKCKQTGGGHVVTTQWKRQLWGKHGREI